MLSEDKEKKSMLETDLKFEFYLGNDSGDINENISENNNFIIIDTILLNNRLKNGDRDEDGYMTLNSTNISNNEECIIEQGEPQTKKAARLSLAVLYRCNGDDCNVRDA